LARGLDAEKTSVGVQTKLETQSKFDSTLDLIKEQPTVKLWLTSHVDSVLHSTCAWKAKKIQFPIYGTSPMSKVLTSPRESSKQVGV